MKSFDVGTTRNGPKKSVVQVGTPIFSHCHVNHLQPKKMKDAKGQHQSLPSLFPPQKKTDPGLPTFLFARCHVQFSPYTTTCTHMDLPRGTYLGDKVSSNGSS